MYTSIDPKMVRRSEQALADYRAMSSTDRHAVDREQVALMGRNPAWSTVACFRRAVAAVRKERCHV